LSDRARVVRSAGKPLHARLRVPGDKSIAHRAVLFNAAATGVARLRNLPDGADVLSSLGAVQALGCRVERNGSHEVAISGRSLRFTAPTGVIDCGNSGTTMRLLMGLLAGQGFPCELDGDASLRLRPMERVAAPLRVMGAEIQTREGKAPIRVRSAALRGTECELQVASAQVKTALLLAALQADGKTVIVEPVATRDHSERMLAAMDAPIEVKDGRITVRGPATIRSIDVDVCGDASSSAFFAVAASIVAGSRLVVEQVSLNPTRLGFVSVLRRMGARIELHRKGESGGEPFGDLIVEAAPLVGTAIEEGEIPSCIDELPVLAVAAAVATGRTTIEGAAELRVKESDRIATVAAMLRAFGVDVAERPDGLVIEGVGSIRSGRLRGGSRIDSFGDHRIAMAAAVGALVADGDTTIVDADAAVVSFPRFFDELAGACA
jgi:3-phosphoshikimate 1-carboxyvinyltransferase